MLYHGIKKNIGKLLKILNCINIIYIYSITKMQDFFFYCFNYYNIRTVCININIIL